MSDEEFFVHRWATVDMPAKYVKCWRLRPLRWMATVGVRREICRPLFGISRSPFDSFRVCTVHCLWVECWWYGKSTSGGTTATLDDTSQAWETNQWAVGEIGNTTKGGWG